MAELTGKTIAELSEDTSLSGAELFPVMDGTTSKKVSYETLRDQFYRVNGGNSITSGTNIDEMLTPGTWVCFSPANVTGGTPPPTQYAYKLTVTRASTNRVWQIVQVLSPACVEYRRNYDANGWGDWVRLDIGGINDKLTLLGDGNVTFERGYIANGATKAFTIATSKRGVVIFTGVYPGASAMYSFFCWNSDNVVHLKEFVGGGLITLTGSENTLTVDNASAGYTYALFIYF